MNVSENMYLLLADRRGEEVFAAGVDPGSASGHVRLPPARPQYLLDHGDPDDLARQRWAVITSSDPRGERALAAIAPLIEARAAAQGDDVMIFRIPSGLGERDVRRWRQQALDGVGVHEAPRYWLIVGELDAMGLEVERELAAERMMVGRLALERADDYAAYAHKLLEHERGLDQVQGPALMFAPADDTRATSRALAIVVDPCKARLEESREQARVELLPGDASADELRDAARERGTLLLSVGHGIAEGEREGERRGALALAHGHQLLAEALAHGRFAPGGAWLLLSSYATGTPSVSPYARWLQEYAHLGTPGARSLLEHVARQTRPSVSSMAKAALANPEGPVIMIGPAGLAWIGADAKMLARAYSDTLVELGRGHRVGNAVASFTRASQRLAAELESSRETRQSADAGARWVELEVIRSVISLGDPAARVVERRRHKRRRGPEDAHELFGFNPRSSP